MMGEALTESWTEEMGRVNGAMGTAGGKSRDELVSVKRSILDIIVVQQQRRIQELEDKLKRTKVEIEDLQKKKERKGIQGSSVPNAVSSSQTPKIEEQLRRESSPIMGTPKISQGGLAKGKSKSAPVRSPTLGILPRYWTEEEHRKFLEGRKMYGPKNYAAISALVATRTPKQVRTHAQKYEMRLVRESAMRSFMGARQIAQTQAQPQQGQQVLPQVHVQQYAQSPQMVPQPAAQPIQQLQAPPARPQAQPTVEQEHPAPAIETPSNPTPQPIVAESKLKAPQNAPAQALPQPEGLSVVPEDADENEFSMELVEANELLSDMQEVPRVHNDLDDLDCYLHEDFEGDMAME